MTSVRRNFATALPAAQIVLLKSSEDRVRERKIQDFSGLHQGSEMPGKLALPSLVVDAAAPFIASAGERKWRIGLEEGEMGSVGSREVSCEQRYLPGLPENATRDICNALAMLLADVFAVYLKTKNFHWHMSGQNFRDYHLLLDEQSTQILAMTDALAERARKIGGTTLRSISHIARLQRLLDNDSQYEVPYDMLAELRSDNEQLAASMRATHILCRELGDVATTGLLESLIDQTEGRIWFLFQSSQV